MANDIDDSDNTNEEIENQLQWTERVMAKVLRNTGCFVSHQGMVIIIKEFGERVKVIEESYK